MNKLVEVIGIFMKFFEDYLELFEFYNNLVVFYVQQKQYDKVCMVFEMVIRIYFFYVIVYENFGDVYVKLVSQVYDKVL